MNQSDDRRAVGSARPDSSVILVTGAAGKTGQAVVRALVARGASVRALVRRSEQAALLHDLGISDVVIGDIQDQATMTGAMQDSRAIYYICPNMHPHEIAIGEMMIGMAQEAGVHHFVYHSVLHPQVESMPHHWAKMRVEERLFESGLPFTILQPTAYMQNILAQQQRILQDRVYTVPYRADARLSLVDLNDIGEVAAIVLTQPGHSYATYELCGTRLLSQDEVAAAIGQQIGRDIRVQVVDLADWQDQARRSGLGPYPIDTLSAMFRYYDAFGLVGNPNVLAWILGRSPTDLPSFVRRSFLV